MSRLPSRRPERRSFRREVLLTCQVVRERDFRLVADLALDLSPEGMLVATRARVLTGERVLVSFRAPRSTRWFDHEATVARVVHGRRPADRGACLGLSFDTLDAPARDQLSRHLRGLPAPDPARPWALTARA